MTTVDEIKAIVAHYDNHREWHDLARGNGNLGDGYYNFSGGEPTNLNIGFPEACRRMTHYLGVLGQLAADSVVLDMGCGEGTPAINMAKQFGCQVIGVDISTNNVKKARSFLNEESSTLRIEFHEENFLNLPQDLLNRKYTHVWAQVSFFHTHAHLRKCIDVAASSLQSGGTFILVDYCGPRHPVFTRDASKSAPDMNEYMQTVKDAGFKVILQEDASRHFLAGTTFLRKIAGEEKNDLEINFYDGRIASIKEGLIGMVIIIAQKQ